MNDDLPDVQKPTANLLKPVSIRCSNRKCRRNFARLGTRIQDGTFLFACGMTCWQIVIDAMVLKEEPTRTLGGLTRLMDEAEIESVDALIDHDKNDWEKIQLEEE